jgi:hypothetical protein
MVSTDVIVIGMLSISYLILGAGCATILSNAPVVKNSPFRNYFIVIGFFCWPLSLLLIIAFGIYYPFEVLYTLLKGEK